MRKRLGWTIHIATLILGLFFGIKWVNRLGVDYNSEGKYFDEIAAVVYDKDGLLVYGILTLFFVLVGLFSWIISIRSKHSKQQK